MKHCISHPGLWVINAIAIITLIAVGCKKAQPPTLTTLAVSDITSNTAKCGGTILSDGGDAVVERGVCCSSYPMPTKNGQHTIDGAGNGSFESIIEGLMSTTTYYVRAYATNSSGTGYGDQLSFTTLPFISVPTVTTSSISHFAQTTATSGGVVISAGNGDITAKGVCWSTSQNPTVSDDSTEDGTGTDSFRSTLTGLNPNTAYYVRAYAINSAGAGYGDQVTFTTSAYIPDAVFNPDLTYGTVSDMEGNVYKTIQIGTQVWMAENLRATKYNDGTPIPLVTSDEAWFNIESPGYCWYNNDSATFFSTCGALYNRYAVMTGKMCPTGWHVATTSDFVVLSNYLGGTDSAGSKLREVDTLHWASPNIEADNSSGFTALPAGSRFYEFTLYRYSAEFWSTGQYATGGISFFLYTAYTKFDRVSGAAYNNGNSVRCLKD
jgi:uncharacterized protein (TIGR02145 family)